VENGAPPTTIPAASPACAQRNHRRNSPAFHFPRTPTNTPDTRTAPPAHGNTHNFHSAPPRRTDRATASFRYRQRGGRIGICVCGSGDVIAASGPGGWAAELPYPPVAGPCVGPRVAASLVV